LYLKIRSRGLLVSWSQVAPTVRYLMETEAHVYALAIAASVLL